jgi:NAD-dependent dihydropyrimidine dehydrogenase PreA subunit
MAHHNLKSGFERLSDRINLFPQGAPPTELLFRILGVLMNEKEAAYMSLLPVKPFRAAAAEKAWRKDAHDAEEILHELSSRALLLDMEQPDGTTMYMMPPPMAGFFEFSLMRIRTDVDQKLLSELFYQYITVEEDFIRELFVNPDTNLGRAFVNEAALAAATPGTVAPGAAASVAAKPGAATTGAATQGAATPGDLTMQVMDYERASKVIKTASHMSISMCYCRHKKQHLGTACDAPMDICMTFGGAASSLIKHGIARRVDETEGMKLLEQAYESNLVQFGENVRNEVSFICNCCGCCCEALVAARRFGFKNSINTTNFLPFVKEEACTGCGKCVNVCPVEALALVSANDPAKPVRKKAKVDERVCLGCAVCIRTCPTGALKLKTREQKVITPVNSSHRAVLMAIENGRLQNLIFDNQAYLSHRAMAAVLGVILKLPPIKQVLASRQMKSRYLDRLLGWYQK